MGGEPSIETGALLRAPRSAPRRGDCASLSGAQRAKTQLQPNRKRARSVHKLTRFDRPARRYPRHVVVSLCSFRVRRLRRRNLARVCGVPQSPLLLAPVRRQGVGRPPRRLRRV